MAPGAEDVGDFFGPENVEPLLAAMPFENPRELAVVEARVIDGGHFEVERLGVAKQKHALAGLRVFVEPAMGHLDTVTVQPKLAIVASKRFERGEVPVVGVKRDERKLGDRAAGEEPQRGGSPGAGVTRQ